jgi:hypothetical protein
MERFPRSEGDNTEPAMPSAPGKWNPHGTEPPPMTPEFGVVEIPTTEAPVPNERKEESEEKPLIPVLDRELMSIGTRSLEQKAEFVSELSNLPPDAEVYLYHGLNGGLGAALGVLESPDHGVRQISGPCLSLYPVGQFWKPGDVGFRYSVPRGLVEFPGEHNLNAQIRINSLGSGLLIGDRTALPVTEFNGEVMRTDRKEDIYEERIINGVTEDVSVGERTVELTDREKEEALKIMEKIAELKTNATD